MFQLLAGDGWHCSWLSYKSSLSLCSFKITISINIVSFKLHMLIGTHNSLYSFPIHDGVQRQGLLSLQSNAIAMKPWFDLKVLSYVQNNTGWPKSCDPNFQVYCGHIIYTVNVNLTKMPSFYQPFEDFTKIKKNFLIFCSLDIEMATKMFIFRLIRCTH